MAKKRAQNKSPDDDFYAVGPVFIRFFLYLLARLGDLVIFITQKSFFLLKKGYFSRSGYKPLLDEVLRVLVNVGLLFMRILVILRSVSLKFTFRLGVCVVICGKFILLNILRIKKFISQIFSRLYLFRAKLRRPRIRTALPRLRIRIPGSFIGFILGVCLTTLLIFVPYNVYLFIKLLPNPHLLSQRFISATTQIFDRYENLLYEIHGDEDRKPVKLSDIPKQVKQATIAIEDKDFYRHVGFSLNGIIRAARETFLHKNIQGGSTLTQQLIKNSLLTPQISITRKAREIILAFWAERIYSKDTILEMYLNQVPYGGTTWGIEAATERYFGKKVQDLNLAEAAYLAGLPAAPTLYSPYGARPELAITRQHQVLKRMVEDHYITQEEADTAIKTTLMIKPENTNIKAPHFVMYIRELLAHKYGDRVVDQGGLRIKTTLDLNLQEKVQEIVRNNVAALTNLRVGNGAALVTDPKHGDILAMVGSKDYFNTAADGNVNVTLALRQPGSSIKVITYAAALESGLTAASAIEDAPVSFPLPNQPAYNPVNYDGRFHGKVTVRTALANSYNIPAVKLLSSVGVSTMVSTAKRMGITTWTDPSRFGLALTLGGGEVTMLDMATVYGVLANTGQRVDLNPILEVSDYTGRIYEQKEQISPVKVLSPDISFILSDILADNTARSAAFGPNSSLVVPGKTVAVKTGTTNEKRDNWTIGYTPSYVVTVWVGNNDNTPMDPYLTSGITGAAPIWNQIMATILKDVPNEAFAPTPNIVAIPCFGRQEYFVKGTESKLSCGFASPQPSVQNQDRLTQETNANTIQLQNNPTSKPKRKARLLNAGN